MEKRFGMTRQQFTIIIALGIIDFIVIATLACIMLTATAKYASAPPKSIPTATRSFAYVDPGNTTNKKHKFQSRRIYRQSKLTTNQNGNGR